MDFNTGGSRRIFHAILLQDLMKRSVCRLWAGDALREECLQFWGWRSSSNRVSEKNMHLD
jgi:hypothetical protein